MNKLTTDQLQNLTDEMNDYMAETGRKLFPPAKADELRELGAKRCSKCATVKLVESFPKDSRARDGLDGKCKTCNSAKTADYRERNPEYQREYDATNRERIFEYKHTRYLTDEITRLRAQLSSGYYRAVAAGNQADWITAEHLLTYWSAKGIDPLVCYLTGESLTPFDRSIDHVVAIGNGGSHTVDNLMPCTLEANMKKKSLDPSDAKELLSND